MEKLKVKIPCIGYVEMQVSVDKIDEQSVFDATVQAMKDDRKNRTIVLIPHVRFAHRDLILNEDIEYYEELSELKFEKDNECCT